MPRRKEPHPLLSTFGDRIRELRLNRNMSLVNLSDTSGVSKGSLSSIENGRINLTVETCVKIAVGLGVRVQDVFPGGLEDLLRSGRESGPESHVKRGQGGWARDWRGCGTAGEMQSVEAALGVRSAGDGAAPEGE